MAMEISRHINAPIETVFDAVTDLRKAEERIEAIVKMEVLTDGPIGVGTRFRETRVMFGKEATEEMEIGSFDRPNGYTVTAESHGCKYLSGFRLEEVDGGTTITMTFEAFPQTTVAKVMGVLTKPLQKKMGEMIGKDLEDIKRAIESR